MFDASLMDRLQCWVGLRAAPVQDDELSFQHRQIQEELQHLLVPQGRRVPMPMAVCVLAIVAMAWAKGPAVWILAWAAALFSIMSLRIWLMGRFPSLMHYPTSQRMQWLMMISVCQGLGFSASALFSPYMSDYQCMVQTIILLGLCAGAVSTTAGYWPLLKTFLMPVTLANAMVWLTGLGGQHSVTWLELTVGGLIFVFGWILFNLAKDSYRILSESVLIRRQQIKSNQQLKTALQQAEQAMQAKTRFLAAASHDLRQPMHTLTLLGGALERKPLDPPTRQIVDHVNQALVSLSTQMDALLDISKLDAQVVSVNSQVFNLGHWLARLVDEFQPVALARRLKLSLSCASSAYVSTDPGLLERIVRNLIDNALKYTVEGEVSVHVEAQEGLWVLRVQDTGCGIAEQEQHKVFEEFYQIGNKERDRAKGLGLGLSIVARLVDLLDLSLELNSVPDQGTCFTLSLEVAPAETQAPVGMAEQGNPEFLQGLKVLVVDDEEPVRQAMQALLGSYGCEVWLASTTRQALLHCLQHLPDVALVDYRLSGSDDGIAAVQSLRGAVPGLAVLLISGDTAPERLREAQAAGLQLLHKPVRA
ncbi:MAG: response regulator, partial [Paucibacter sp.]|nr:response regulator [Roseateles sp.]